MINALFGILCLLVCALPCFGAYQFNQTGGYFDITGEGETELWMSFDPNVSTEDLVAIGAYEIAEDETLKVVSMISQYPNSDGHIGNPVKLGTFNSGQKIGIWFQKKTEKNWISLLSISKPNQDSSIVYLDRNGHDFKYGNGNIVTDPNNKPYITESLGIETSTGSTDGNFDYNFIINNNKTGGEVKNFPVKITDKEPVNPGQPLPGTLTTLAIAGFAGWSMKRRKAKASK